MHRSRNCVEIARRERPEGCRITGKSNRNTYKMLYKSNFGGDRCGTRKKQALHQRAHFACTSAQFGSRNGAENPQKSSSELFFSDSKKQRLSARPFFVNLLPSGRAGPWKVRLKYRKNHTIRDVAFFWAKPL